MLLITLEPLIVVFVISILSPLLWQRVGVAPLFSSSMIWQTVMRNSPLSFLWLILTTYGPSRLCTSIELLVLLYLRYHLCNFSTTKFLSIFACIHSCILTALLRAFALSRSPQSIASSNPYWRRSSDAPPLNNQPDKPAPSLPKLPSGGRCYWLASFLVVAMVLSRRGADAGASVERN
jgi:hypothetical protein